MRYCSEFLGIPLDTMPLGDHAWSALAEAAEIRFEKPGYVELVFSLVLVWGFGDALSTLFAARFAGHHLEANPWVGTLLAHSPLVVLVLKMAGVLYVGVVLLECRDLVERVPLWRSWLLVNPLPSGGSPSLAFGETVNTPPERGLLVARSQG